MRILLYSDYPALFTALHQEAQRYSGIKLLNAAPNTQPLTLPDFDFIIVAPLAASHELAASQLNAWQAPLQTLASMCQARHARLLLLSSDCVFSPQQTHPSELDTPESQTPLAKSLLQLESTVAQLPQAIILRTPPCLTETGVVEKGVRANLKTQIGSDPSGTRGLQTLNDLARVILGMLLQLNSGAQASGLFHYAGTPALGQCSLNTQHLMNTFGIHPRAWQESLAKLPAAAQPIRDPNHAAH